MMRPDPVVERGVGRDSLGEYGREGDLGVIEALDTERAVEVLDHAAGLRRVVGDADVLAPAADIVPTGRFATVWDARTRSGIQAAQKP
jgi:hypothetical protein